MDIGVDQSGFNTICAIESDSHCVATLKRNAPKKKRYGKSIFAHLTQPG